MSIPSPHAVAGHTLAPGLLQRLRLRWLTAGVTLIFVAACILLALIDRQAAPAALACALFIAAKGLAWLLYLRHQRLRLRRYGYRW